MQPAGRLSVGAFDGGSGKILGGELVWRRAGQGTAAETVGKTEKLQARIGLPRAVADQGDGFADEIGIVLAEQLGAVRTP